MGLLELMVVVHLSTLYRRLVGLPALSIGRLFPLRKPIRHQLGLVVEYGAIVLVVFQPVLLHHLLVLELLLLHRVEVQNAVDGRVYHLLGRCSVPLVRVHLLVNLFVHSTSGVPTQLLLNLKVCGTV